MLVPALAHTVEPPIGEEFSLAARGASEYRVAASLDRFLVVWTDSSSGISADVLGRFVEPIAGAPLGDAFVIAGSHAAESTPAVASDGHEFLVAWHVGSEIRASRVSDTGDVMDPGGFLIVDNGTEEGNPRRPHHPVLAWNGGEWVAAWHEVSWGSGLIETGWIDRTTREITPGFTEGPGAGTTLASNGPSTLLAFDSVDADCVSVYRLSRLGLAGGGCASARTGDRAGPQGLATDGHDFLITYGCHEDCMSPTSPYPPEPRSYAIEVNGTSAAPMLETRKPVSDVGYEVSDAAFAGHWLIAREEIGSPGPDVYVDDFRILTAASYPRIAVSGDTGLVIATRGADVIGRTFGVDGPPPTPVPGSSTPSPSPSLTPSPTSTTPIPTPVGIAGGQDSPGCECAVGGVGRRVASFPLATLIAVSLAFAYSRRRFA